MSIRVFALCSIVIAATLVAVAYRSSGFMSNLCLSGAEVFGGFAIALVAINGYLNPSEKRKVAVVILKSVHSDIVEYHKLFIESGHTEFGIPTWNGIIDSMNEHGRDPNVLNPAQKSQVIRLIQRNRGDIVSLTSSMRDRLKDVTYVLGWSFHPKVTRDCMLARYEIDELQLLLSLTGRSTVQDDRLIELYFDIDADSSAVLTGLARIGGIDVI